MALGRYDIPTRSYLLKNNGGGFFSAITNTAWTPQSQSYESISSVDYNGDGLPDLLGREVSRTFPFRNNGGENFVRDTNSLLYNFHIGYATLNDAWGDYDRAVVAVDIYGFPCELDELRALCDARGIALIEDACEALGARYKSRPVGSHGPPAVFAFYPNKQMTTGEGGMVTTHSESEWRLLRSLRNQGRADSGGWLEHARLGFNYRLDDVRAAIGLGQLEKLDDILASRASVAARYSELLGEIPGLELPCVDDADHERSWFVNVVTLPSGTDREAVIASLDARGLQTARYLPCIHLQPYMQDRFGFRVGLCPVAEDVSARTPFFFIKISPGT